VHRGAGSAFNVVNRYIAMVDDRLPRAGKHRGAAHERECPTTSPRGSIPTIERIEPLSNRRRISHGSYAHAASYESPYERSIASVRRAASSGSRKRISIAASAGCGSIRSMSSAIGGAEVSLVRGRTAAESSLRGEREGHYGGMVAF
jgi:hypothetical protein